MANWGTHVFMELARSGEERVKRQDEQAYGR